MIFDKPMNYSYQVFSTPQALAQQFAGMFAGWVAQQLETKPCLYIALSGGSTPQLWFAALAENFADRIEWAKLHFFWVDERYVPHHHPESNYGVACRLLFNRINIPQGNLHPAQVTGDIENDIQSYADEIRKHVPIEDGWPVFDWLTLGMGIDGHTASIFPGQLALFDSRKFVVVSENPHTHQQRITFTGKLINHAAMVYFLVTGKDKAPLVRDIFTDVPGADNFPAFHIRNKNTTWLMDQETAGMLS